jgi:hypothetical protein
MKTPITGTGLIKIGLRENTHLIQVSYSYILDNYKAFDDILKKDIFHYKEISLSLCNDTGKNEYYVFIREGDTNKRHEDVIITLSRNYQYIEQVQTLINALQIEVEK